ncbi:glycosyltransferase [Falsiruegeria mediterranea]|uniref:2-deoxystreptamine glucosyltransferase n=1 Tax=Falsiruegeria mediterranea M17 TaxID=1200281 RepID=A0A2R8CGE7_9RHOB|nr:glycosyltransferase [Falsiruegeria mediterranea]SPJ31509.1 2-deoxystreptamine glucosyltransferase [Falsiruegeria mediterranea M17]
MSIASFAKNLTLSFDTEDRPITDAEKDVLFEALASDEADLATKLALLSFVNGIGETSEIAGATDTLITQLREEGRNVSESLQQISGFVNMFLAGFILPERRAPRTRSMQRTVLNFYHALPPFHTSGYAMRSHALATAARNHGAWQHKHHSRIGYPWDVRGKHRNPNARTTWYDGTPYLHDRGTIGARGDLRAHILAATAAIRRAIYLERPSVVQAASAYVNALPVLIAAREMGVPFVYEVRGLWEITAAMGRPHWKNTDRFKIDFDIECMIAREADGVIAITNGVRDELIRRGVDADNIVLSPNSVSDGSLENLPCDQDLQDELGLLPGIPTLGYIGSFVKYEGLEMLVEACQKLRQEGYEFNLLLVGDGPHYQTFKNNLDEMGCVDTVILPGRVPHEEVARYYSLIDITVFPRLSYEVCELVSPLKPLEALLLEKLVIGSSVGGIREIIEHEKNGLIFEAGSTGALTDQLRVVLSSPEEFDALRKKGREWVLENRKWSQNIATVEELLTRVSHPVMQPLEAPIPVTPGQIVSAQASVNGESDTLDFIYTDAQGHVIQLQEELVATAREKEIPVDNIVPQNAIQLIDVTSRNQNQVNVSNAPLETYTRIDAVSRHPLNQTCLVTSEPLETREIHVTPGMNYSLVVDVVTPAQVPNHALIGLVLLDGEKEAVLKTGLLTVDERSDAVYCYLQKEEGEQVINFRVPDTVSKISIYVQKWSGKKLRSAEVSSHLQLKTVGEYTKTRHLRLADRSENDITSSDELVLKKAPVIATMAVEPGRRYELTFETQPAPRKTPPSMRAGIITFKGTDENGTGDAVAFPGLRFSDNLDSYYEYFTCGQKEKIPVTIPEGVNQLELGLACWSASDRSIICSDAVLLSEKTDQEFSLNWNVDRTKSNILLFADLDVNLVDGSAVWMVSIANALSRLDNVQVHVLLRKPITESPFVDDLNSIENCRIIDAVSHFQGGSSFSSKESPEIISRLDEMVGGFDYLVLRGFQVNYALTKNARLNGRLCPYLTDIPQTDDTLEQEKQDQIELIFRRAGRIFLQSDWLISFVKRKFPAHVDKLFKLPPMLPEVAEKATVRAGAFPVQEALAAPKTDTLKIVYAGKMAPEWGILELFDAFDTLRHERPDLELHVLGSKVHNPPEDPEYYDKVISRLGSGNGIVWQRSLDRQTVLQMLQSFDVGWSWRDPEFENSNLELSTKLLEYGASGLPVILTRTDRYEQLLGKDYPLLADNYAGALEAMRLALDSAETRQAAADRLGSILAPHAMAAVSRCALAPALPMRTKRQERILLTGHDLKFSGDIQASLVAQGYSVCTDLWAGHERHDEVASTNLLLSSDIIFCEWALGNLVWYSHRVQPGQKLIARLHAQEIFTDYPRAVKWDAVDTVIFVSENYRRMGIEQFGIPEEKCVVIPNSVDMNWFSPVGQPVRGKRLGIMGIVPWLKRPDRAVRILELLREEDPEFSLSIKGKLPSDYPWMRNRSEEGRLYTELTRHIIATPGLKEAISFDGFGHDVPVWASGIDFILSTSDRESFHLAIPEAAATGAQPVILPWEGAQEIYPENWVVADEEAAAEFILRKVAFSQKTRKRHAAKNRDYVARTFSLQSVSNMILDLIQADPQIPVPSSEQKRKDA